MTGPSTQITAILLRGIKYWLRIYESKKRDGCAGEGVAEGGGPWLPYLASGCRARQEDRLLTVLGRDRVRVPVNSIAAASRLPSAPSTGVRGWNHCMVHAGAFCHPKTEDEVKNKKAVFSRSVIREWKRCLSLWSPQQPQLMACWGLTCCRPGSWLPNAHLSMFVLPVGTWACGSGQDRAFKKLGSIRNSNLSFQVPSSHCVAEQHSFLDWFVHLFVD